MRNRTALGARHIAVAYPSALLPRVRLLRAAAATVHAPRGEGTPSSHTQCVAAPATPQGRRRVDDSANTMVPVDLAGGVRTPSYCGPFPEGGAERSPPPLDAAKPEPDGEVR